ncbi:Glycine--tRNA ligase alpha subunit [Varanus komodoensis]|nr:Glycine--tRNA ligase alpha subunit [Varanus komodoensis]
MKLLKPSSQSNVKNKPNIVSIHPGYISSMNILLCVTPKTLWLYENSFSPKSSRAGIITPCLRLQNAAISPADSSRQDGEMVFISIKPLEISKKPLTAIGTANLVSSWTNTIRLGAPFLLNKYNGPHDFSVREVPMLSRESSGNQKTTVQEPTGLAVDSFYSTGNRTVSPAKPDGRRLAGGVGQEKWQAAISFSNLLPPLSICHLGGNGGKPVEGRHPYPSVLGLAVRIGGEKSVSRNGIKERKLVPSPLAYSLIYHWSEASKSFSGLEFNCHTEMGPVPCPQEGN